MSFLDEIASEKLQEVRLRRGFIELKGADQFRSRSSFVDTISKPGLSYICEIKKASPSEGALRQLDPSEIAKVYESAGASAISVLTDKRHFGGGLEDLILVRENTRLPVLMKDFIVDKQQIREARSCGADAVLLIVALLGDRTKEFVEYARHVGLDCLVEVHDQSELECALASGAKIIGVNNRDLNTLKVDLSTFEKVAPNIPDDILAVAESGIKTREDVLRMEAAGADAVLIGSSLMKSANIPQKLKELGL